MADNDGNDARTTVEADFGALLDGESQATDTTEAKDTQDSSTEEQNQNDKKAEETDTDVSSEETKDTTEDAESEDNAEKGDTEDEDDDKEDPKPKANNKAENRIRNLVSDKRALQRQVEELTARLNPLPSVEELQNDGMTEADAKVAILEQRQAMKEYNDNVVSLTSDVETESKQVTQDFPIFDKNSDQYDEDLANAVGESYIEMSGIQTDEQGNITRANVLPYKFYETIAKAIDKGVQQGQIKGKEDAKKQYAASDKTGIAPPKEAKADPVMDALLKGLDN